MDIEVLAEPYLAPHSPLSGITEYPHLIAEPQKGQSGSKSNFTFFRDIVVQAKGIEMRHDRSRTAYQRIFGISLYLFKILFDIPSEWSADIHLFIIRFRHPFSFS